jgi:hypothetical protein
MCVDGRPVALVPLWQFAQLLVSFEWSSFTGIQASVP